MKIYVVVELAKFNENCTKGCWKVVRAFARKDDAEKYIKAQKFPDDFDIEDLEFVEGF